MSAGASPVTRAGVPLSGPIAPRRGPWAEALLRLVRNHLAVGSLVFLALLSLVALFAGAIAPFDPAYQNYEHVFEKPGWPYLLGTDNLGRDAFSRLIHGAQVSLTVGLFAQAILVVIGLPLGALAAFFGGRTDALIMRFVDIIYAFPELLLIILLRSIFGGSIFMMFIAIGLVDWTTLARLSRAQILSLKQQDYVTAARALGAPWHQILVRHMLPNGIGPVIVAIVFGIPRAIFAEAALSYIGIGVDPPTPSWGTMVQQGYQAMLAFPHLILAPALAIGAVTLAFTFVGDGLRDALDPRDVRR